jgi:CRISPR-associated endonuclease/helicase Cas3
MSYFDLSSMVDVSSLINENITFYAHLDNDRKEYLQEHIDLVNKYFIRIVKAKGIDKIFKNYEDENLKDLSEDGKIFFKKLLLNICNFHDIGKINPEFQYIRMNNKIDMLDVFLGGSSNHSIFSSILYIDYFVDESKSLDKDSRMKILEYIFLNSYIISKHHGSLDSFYKFLDKFYRDENKEVLECIKLFTNKDSKLYKKDFKLNYNILENLIKVMKNNYKNKDMNKAIDDYLYVKLCYSLLVASDFYATSEFMNKVSIEDYGEIYNIEDFYKYYKETEVYKSIRNYEIKEYKNNKNLLEEKNINILRIEMFLDSEKELINNIDNDIFFLEAPTGSGKSNVSLNLSFKLFEKNNSLRKIFYVYPFNTLVEQNIKSLKKIFGEENEAFKSIAIINSITPIKGEDKEINDQDERGKLEYYSKALLNRQFLNYPMVLTTHVSIFNNMFNSSKESAFAFHQLANSVIVLDEIQSYKNLIWSEIIIFLKRFSKILNMKVIIMSATLPNLNYLTESDFGTCNLIKDREKYFSNPLFKNRVEINYDLLDKDIEAIYNHVKLNSKNKNKILIEFIKKQSAYDFYNRLKEDSDITSVVELMTGDDNVIERERILKIVENEEDIILVATQVIEAGVDIDMDIGYKDISKLDSDEQFMGRINRSCKRSGVVYFFNLDETSIIYQNDVRVNTDYSLLNKEMRSVLINKSFSDYYKLILDSIKRKFNEAYNDNNLESFIKDSVGRLNFRDVEKRMELISDDIWSLSVFLARTINLENGKAIDGREVWHRYEALLKDNKMKYAEKEFKLSEVRSLANYFIYQVKKSDILYNDRIGEIYYIENGENYFKDEKIDKEKLTTGIGDFI